MSFAANLAYEFRDTKLLAHALTHPGAAKPYNNQRLEFLGDGVLGLVIAHLLYARYPNESEGDLARRQAALVRGETLAQVAERIHLADELVVAEGELMNGRSRTSGLEDACEALIGALYLDGGLEAAQSFITRHWEEFLGQDLAPPKDAKTALQEFSQGKNLGLPRYEVAAQSGPSHAPHFTVRVSLEKHGDATGEGASKREAEQLAATNLLVKVQK